MSRSRSLALVGAAALLLMSAAPIVAQDEATTDDTMDMEALAIDVGGVEYAFTNLPTPAASALEAASQFVHAGIDSTVIVADAPPCSRPDIVIASSIGGE